MVGARLRPRDRPQPDREPVRLRQRHVLAPREPPVPAPRPYRPGMAVEGGVVVRASPPGLGVGRALVGQPGLPALLGQRPLTLSPRPSGRPANRLRGRSGRPGSNRRHSAWKADALPTELHPRVDRSVACRGSRVLDFVGPRRSSRSCSPPGTWSSPAGDRAPRRLVAFVAGFVLVAAALLSPLATIACTTSSRRTCSRTSCSRSGRRRCSSAGSRPRWPRGSRGSARSACSRSRSWRSRSGRRPTRSGTSRPCTTRRCATTRCSRWSTSPTSPAGCLLWWWVCSTRPMRSLGTARGVRLRRVRPREPGLALAHALARADLRVLRGGAARHLGHLAGDGPADRGMTMAAEQSIVFFVVFVLWFVRFLAEEERREEVA